MEHEFMASDWDVRKCYACQRAGFFLQFMNPDLPGYCDQCVKTLVKRRIRFDFKSWQRPQRWLKCRR